MRKADKQPGNRENREPWNLILPLKVEGVWAAPSSSTMIDFLPFIYTVKVGTENILVRLQKTFEQNEY